LIQDRIARRRLDEEQINTALAHVRAILQCHEVISFAYLHGSVVDFLRGKQSLLPRDIDVAIYLTGGDWIRVELELQSEFYGRTGLSPEVLDVHTLNNAPLSVRMQTIKQGRLLFCRDRLAHADFIENVSNAFRQLAGLLETAYV